MLFGLFKSKKEKEAENKAAKEKMLAEREAEIAAKEAELAAKYAALDTEKAAEEEKEKKEAEEKAVAETEDEKKGKALNNQEEYYWCGLYNGGKVRGNWKHTKDEVEAEANSNLYKNRLGHVLTDIACLPRDHVKKVAEEHGISIAEALSCAI
jgi:hypothetical protein